MIIPISIGRPKFAVDFNDLFDTFYGVILPRAKEYDRLVMKKSTDDVDFGSKRVNNTTEIDVFETYSASSVNNGTCFLPAIGAIRLRAL
jgi:hypothetical protein